MPGQPISAGKLLDAFDVPVVQTGDHGFVLAEGLDRGDAKPALHVVKDDVAGSLAFQAFEVRQALEGDRFYVWIISGKLPHHLVEHVRVLVILPGRGMADLDQSLGQSVVVAGQVNGCR